MTTTPLRLVACTAAVTAVLALVAAPGAARAAEPQAADAGAPAPDPAATDAGSPATAEAGSPGGATPTGEQAKPEETKPPPKGGGPREPEALTWDINIEGAFGRAFGDVHGRTVSFLRARAGVLWVHDPWFTSFGAFYDLSNFTPGTFGVQVEQMHLSTGFWLQAGGGIDVEPRPMGMLSVGWSVIGVEGQVREFGDAGVGPAIFGKLRIPLGVIVYALRTRK